MSDDMTVSLSKRRCLLLLSVPLLLVALSSCGSTSDEASSNDTNQESELVDTDSDADGQEGTASESTDQGSADQENADQENTGPEDTDPEITGPEDPEPDGSEQGNTGGSITIDQPNILLVITDDQGIDCLLYTSPSPRDRG